MLELDSLFSFGTYRIANGIRTKLIAILIINGKLYPPN